MSSRRWRFFVEDILGAIEHVRGFVRGIPFERFAQDELILKENPRGQIPLVTQLSPLAQSSEEMHFLPVSGRRPAALGEEARH